ncbi:unnamed protein product [Caenorhabditis angaria]|uniref:Uncharacterized protein n=1 Tax=Caenorhabditis angaria TaxID=860376 RepID=A0A9P1II77_9PELO|nr:unnamed protein product [Caenorhabditis angaria]
MGQYFSSSQSNSASNTPQRIPNCIDPRSPTRDIDRTPIQINDDKSGDENSTTAIKNEPKRQSLRQKIIKKKAEEEMAKN